MAPKRRVTSGMFHYKMEEGRLGLGEREGQTKTGFPELSTNVQIHLQYPRRTTENFIFSLSITKHWQVSLFQKLNNYSRSFQGHSQLFTGTVHHSIPVSVSDKLGNTDESENTSTIMKLLASD